MDSQTPAVAHVNAIVRPVRTALFVAGLYLALASAYILISSTFASERVGSVEDLRQIEILKGLAFVLGSAILLFAVNWGLLQRIRQNDERGRRMERSLHNAERTVLAGTFARTIAHDINNGLLAAQMNLELLDTEVADNPEARELVGEATRALARITEWNRRFFEIGGQQLFGAAKAMNLTRTISSAAELARHHRSVRTATLELSLLGVASYTGFDSVIQRAVLNLILNAADAAGADAVIHVHLLPSTSATWKIIVEDNGPGIAPENRARILEPFFTTKEHGTGLGLASVLGCARFHHGDLRVDDSPLGGARFTLTLGEVPVSATGDAPSEKTANDKAPGRAAPGAS
jgi:signal transduction histidine kinase